MMGSVSFTLFTILFVTCHGFNSFHFASKSIMILTGREIDCNYLDSDKEDIK
jgi:hypothetical protein